MKQQKKIKINKEEFNLVKTDNSAISCSVCVFGKEDKCKLIYHQTDIDAEEENEMFRICQLDIQTHWEKVRDINDISEKEDDSEAEKYADSFFEPHEKEDKHANISSTGGESPVNNTPRVTKADTKRSINIELTLKEAREYYDSHNPILKDIACRLFTPAELEDVRRCTMNIDLKTAKRLYRNAENVARDFVLSAFSKEELEH